jgi:hypothetical protein
VIDITERIGPWRQALSHDLRGTPMKMLMPLMLTAPTLIQGGLAMRSRRGGSTDLRSRQLKVGIIFNICYLIAVGVASLMLALD